VSIILGHLGMLIALRVVLVLIAIRILAGIVTGLRGSVDWNGLARTVTRPLLIDVLPLILLSWLLAVDPTHIVVRVWYYVAAAVIAIRILMELINLVRK
jgi:hypothetical protein